MKSSQLAVVEVGWSCIGARLEQVRALVEELEALRVVCHPALRGSGPGLVFFGEVSDEVRACVRERSRGGVECVIAVGTQRQSLERFGGGWELLDDGAADVVHFGDPAATADVIAARFRRWEEVERLVQSPLVRRNLVGESPCWRALLRRAVDVARFSALPILIGGESGTGKELVARLVHTLDPRQDKKELIILDCTTVVSELSGSEFFGHERGSYTGATDARDGAFALANGGTLFLDEVGELPARLQAELLRVVQEGTYKRVGGNAVQRTRFRLLCATHRDLQQEIKQARFRTDFYYRIAACQLTLPSLRERREDIALLARHFLEAHYPAGEAPPFDDAVLQLLLARDYPGNVRELKNLVAGIAARHTGSGPITPGDVPDDARPRAGSWKRTDPARELFERAGRMALLCGMSLREISNAAADASVRLALELEEGNVGRAAERLRITDRGLQKRRAVWKEGQRDLTH